MGYVVYNKEKNLVICFYKFFYKRFYVNLKVFLLEDRLLLF